MTFIILFWMIKVLMSKKMRGNQTENDGDQLKDDSELFYQITKFGIILPFFFNSK